MLSLSEYHEEITGKPDHFAYYGDLNLDIWGVAIARHRDSSVLERSNFEVVRDNLMQRFPGDVTTEEYSHWAVGWVEKVLIDTTNPLALGAAYDWYTDLQDYPVADEEHYSDMEFREVEECFESYGREEVIAWLQEYPDRDPGILDKDGEPIEGLEAYLFHLFHDCHSYNGEYYVNDDAMDYAMDNVLPEVVGELRRIHLKKRAEYEKVQPPLYSE